MNAKKHKKTSAFLGYKAAVSVKKTPKTKSRNGQTADVLHRSANVKAKDLSTQGKSVRESTAKKRSSVSDSEKKAKANATPLKDRKHSVKDLGSGVEGGVEELSAGRVKETGVTRADLEKYAEALREAMNLVNSKSPGEISFETLGNFFQLVDVYKDMDEVNSEYERSSQETERKRQKEVRFHKSFWKLFNSDFNGKIKTEPVIEIFLQLYTSDLNNSSELEHAINSTSHNKL